MDNHKNTPAEAIGRLRCASCGRAFWNDHHHGVCPHCPAGAIKPSTTPSFSTTINYQNRRFVRAQALAHETMHRLEPRSDLQMILETVDLKTTAAQLTLDAAAALLQAAGWTITRPDPDVGKCCSCQLWENGGWCPQLGRNTKTDAGCSEWEKISR